MSWPYLDSAGADRARPPRRRSRTARRTRCAPSRGAVRCGYRYLETDVHATADGVLLAFHDDRLDRVADRNGADRRAAVLARSRGPRVGGEPIPLLEDLLGAWPEVRVNIDIKAADAIEPLVEVLDRTGARDRVCVGSFSQARLTRFRRLTHGRVCTSLGPVEVAGVCGRSPTCPGFRCSAGRRRAGSGGDAARLGRLPIVDRRFVDTAHRRGVQVHVWTINDPAEMRRLLDLGVDGLITDRPSVLKSVLVERGQWR